MQQVVLKREPNNPYDSMAIVVLKNGRPVGHAPREIAMLVRLSDSQMQVILRQGSDFSSYINVFHPTLLNEQRSLDKLLHPHLLCDYDWIYESAAGLGICPRADLELKRLCRGAREQDHHFHLV